jgi:hypothetical protein
MRQYAQLVDFFTNDLITKIKDYFVARPDILKLELKNTFIVDVDVEKYNCYRTEERVIVAITNDGYLIDEEDNEISINDINVIELAFILDEIADQNYTPITQ